MTEWTGQLLDGNRDSGFYRASIFVSLVEQGHRYGEYIARVPLEAR
jgi:hypothetical protein